MDTSPVTGPGSIIGLGSGLSVLSGVTAPAEVTLVVRSSSTYLHRCFHNKNLKHSSLFEHNKERNEEDSGDLLIELNQSEKTARIQEKSIYAVLEINVT